MILNNVFEISRILQELAQAGYPVEPEAAAALSPYWTHHVNRFGGYSLNLDRCPPTIDFEAPILLGTMCLNLTLSKDTVSLLKPISQTLRRSAILCKVLYLKKDFV